MKKLLLVLFLTLAIGAARAEDIEAPNGEPFDWRSFDRSAAALDALLGAQAVDLFCDLPRPQPAPGEVYIFYRRDAAGSCVADIAIGASAGGADGI